MGDGWFRHDTHRDHSLRHPALAKSPDMLGEVEERACPLFAGRGERRAGGGRGGGVRNDAPPRRRRRQGVSRGSGERTPSIRRKAPECRGGERPAAVCAGPPPRR